MSSNEPRTPKPTKASGARRADPRGGPPKVRARRGDAHGGPPKKAFGGLRGDAGRGTSAPEASARERVVTPKAAELEVASTSRFGEALDELAAAVFDGELGRRRLAPLLTRWDDEAAPLRDDEPDYASWQVIRTDWALCDALAHDAAGPGDTWALRALRGRVLGFLPEARHFEVAATVAGLYEVWPGRVPWMRDCVGGLCLPLADPVRLEPVGEDEPAALWEARVAIVDGRAHLCRPPLPYPLEVLGSVRDRQLRRFAPGGRMPSLALLRRARLRWRRAERADASVMFRLIHD